MANMHIKAAAQNLRQAVIDVEQQLKQAEADHDREAQRINKQIFDLKQDQRGLAADSVTSDSNQEKALNATQIQRNERQISELNRDLFRVNDDLRKAQAELEKQIAEYKDIAITLEKTA